MAWDRWIRTVEIEPSLYAADHTRLADQVEVLLRTGARIFHWDVGDGRFIEPLAMGSVPLQPLADLIHRWEGVVDVHLMVEEPERLIPSYAASGADSVTFHLEACDDVSAVAALAREHGLQAGLAISPDTPVEDAVAEAEHVDLVLCMGVVPGYSGQVFIPETLNRLHALKESLPAGTFLEVDGGITNENVRGVWEAGAELIVAGSAIFQREDLPRAYRRLVQALV